MEQTDNAHTIPTRNAVPTMLSVWREVAAHLRIDEAVSRIAPFLRGELDFQALIVRRVDLAQMRVETVAESWSHGGAPADREAGRQQALSRTATEALSGWIRSGRPIRVCPAASDPTLLVTGWADWRGDLIAGLLASGDQVQGVVLLLCAPGEFSVAHVELAEALLEPVRVALANDARLREMERVQAALEGYRRVLAAVIERPAIPGNGEGLDVAAAPGSGLFTGPPGAQQSAWTAASTAAAASRARVEPLDLAMAAHISKALSACRGRIEGDTGAAKLLGINPHTLRSRMRKLGIEWARFRVQPAKG